MISGRCGFSFGRRGSSRLIGLELFNSRHEIVEIFGNLMPKIAFSKSDWRNVAAANEIAVQAFLDGKARFTDIPRVIRSVLEEHSNDPAGTLEDLLVADTRARETAANRLAHGVPR